MHGLTSLMGVLATAAAATAATAADWQEIGPRGADIAELRSHPSLPGVVYARSPNTGIHRSSDGGLTWRNCLVQQSGHGTTSFALSPEDPNELLAIRFEERLYRSTDACVSWDEITDFPDRNLYLEGRHALTYVPGRSGVVLLAAGDLLRSDDGGESWTEIDTVPEGFVTMVVMSRDGRQWWISRRARPLLMSDDDGIGWTEVNGVEGVRSMVTDPFDDQHIVAESFSTLHRSTDGGATFEIASSLDGDDTFSSVAFDPVVPGRLWAVIDGGSAFDVFASSSDSGVTWTVMDHPSLRSTSLNDVLVVDDHDRLLVARSHGVAASDDLGASWYSANDGFAGLALGCQRSCLATFARRPGSLVTINQLWTDDGGSTWTRSGGDDFLHWFRPEFLTADPFDPDSLYTGGLSFLFRSRDRGVTFDRVETGPDGAGGSLVLDPHDADYWFTTMDIGMGVVRAFRSSDTGQSWHEIFTGIEAEITDLLVDPHTPGVVLALAADNSIYRSDDRGESWSLLHELSGFPFFLRPRIVFDPTTPGRIYATIWSGAAPEVHVTDDGGASWDISTGPVDFMPDAIAPDPIVPGRVYGFSDYIPPFPLKARSKTHLEGYFGIVVTDDAGAGWAPFEPTLDSHGNVVLDLQFSADGRDLYAIDGFNVYRLEVHSRGPRRGGSRVVPD